MIRVRHKVVAILLLLFLVNSLCLPPPASAEPERLKTYVVYDSLSRFGTVFPVVTALIEYLGHFNLDCQTLALDKWRPGALKDAEMIVYVGLEPNQLPQALLAEMAQATRLIWFEKNIEQMARYLKWSDFSYDGVSSGWSYFNYKQESYFPDFLPVVLAQPGQAAEVFITVSDGNQLKPLAWNRDNVYFCGLLEFDWFFMTTLANLLYQFIPNDFRQEHNALFRVEDVSPLVAPKAVSAVIAAIEKFKIPFAIGVIPVGVDANDNYIYLHDSPELVKVLKAAQDNGASIIMHGYTHQNNYSPKTGEGYEFWNARDDRTMDNDAEFTRERIEAGIAELVRCGLYPVAFEAPHYAMSETGYKVLSEYFNIYSGELQISDLSSQITLTLPYPSYSNYLQGMFVLPENMGYYDGQEFLAEAMLEKSKRLLEVKDGFAGFFYHGYLPPDKIDMIVAGLQQQGYQFYNLRQLPIRVQSPQIQIVGEHGQLSVTVDEKLSAVWRQADADKGWLTFEQLTKGHIGVVTLAIAAFCLIILRLKAQKKQRYEE